MNLRIAVADDEPRVLQFYQECLSNIGHTVVATARTGAELLACCQRTPPDLIITDIKMPDMDGLEAASIIWQELTVPVILVSGYPEEEYLNRAQSAHIMAFLVKPIKKEDLAPAIVIAERRFAEFKSMRQEATDLRQALQDRKLVEHTKGILMKMTGLDEPAAFRRMQDLARRNNRKLVQVAEMILSAEEAFAAPERTGNEE